MSEDDPLKNDVLLQLNDNDNANEPGDETEENERRSETGAEVTLRNRFKNDEAFRQKIMVWVCLCLSTALLGWDIGQLGPSLLDLQDITKCRLEEASFFLTSVFFGYLLGTSICGVIYQRMNPFLLLFLGISFLGITSATIPWCAYYWLMLFMHFIKGFGFGVLDTAGNSVFMVAFKDEKTIQSYLNTIHLMFAIGGFLSPIATAPFLMQPFDSDEGDMMNSSRVCMVSSLYKTCGILNSSVTATHNSKENFSLECKYFGKYDDNLFLCHENVTENRNNSTSSDINKESKLYKAYSITATFCVILAVRFLWMYLRNGHFSKKIVSENKDPGKRQLSFRQKLAVLIIMCLFLSIDNGMEDTFFGMFTTFIVIQLGWTKQQGSYAISVYWASFAIGRLSSIFIGAKIDFRRLLCYYINLFLLAMIGFFVSVMYRFDIGVWICFPIMGFAVSVFFPSIFLWTADFMTVAGKVSSCLLVCASLGSMINPILIGFLMDNFDAMWFAYVTLANGIVLWLMFWIARSISKFLRTRRSIEVEIEV